MADDLHEIAEKWWTPPAGIVGKLPRVTCKACIEKRCQEHKPTKCATCGQFISPRHIHLDFVGHADLTRTFIEIDPDWNWQPLALDEMGLPRIVQRGRQLVLWANLTLLGKTTLCVGTCDDKSDADKELVGDMLRNGGMRFGIFGALWSKTDGWQDDDTTTNAPTNEGAAVAENNLITGPQPTTPLPPVVISQPDKPLVAMTMRELLDFATANGITVSGTKSDIVRILEPLVRAASGEEPWPVEGEGVSSPLSGVDHRAGMTDPAAPSRPEPDAIPFAPVIADDPIRHLPPKVRDSIRGGRGA